MTAEQAFDHYHEPVFRFVYRLTLRSDLAEDVTQECFLAFLRDPARFNPARGSLKTYLFSIARNLVLKEYRDNPQPMPLDGDSMEPAVAPDLSIAVAQAVRGLPPLQQEALILFEYEGFTLEEIAQVAGADPGTIKSRLHRARENLKRVLRPYQKVGDVHGAV